MKQNYGTTAQFGKKSQTGFLSQFKVWKTKESCMYFWFFKLKKWDKKTMETRRRNCAVVPYYLTLDMAERRLIIESLNNLRSQAYCSGTVYRRS